MCSNLLDSSKQVRKQCTVWWNVRGNILELGYVASGFFFRPAIYNLISYRIHWKYRTEKQLSSCKLELETLRNPLNAEMLKLFESFIEYRGFNNSQEINCFPGKKEHGNKNGDIFVLKTFKTNFNLNVHLNVSHIWKTKTNIFFKKINKGLK